MDPLKIDLVLTKILTNLSHPIDLKNCRLVDQHWNLMATSVLNDRGATCVVSDENYYDFFQNRAKNIAGLNLTLNLTAYSSGRSLAVLAMTKELQQDKSKIGTGSYCVKTINYCAKIDCLNDYLDATIFWPLVDVTASDLGHLLIAGAIKPDPTQPVPDNGEDVPPLPEPATQFPVLKSVIFDIRRHNRTRQKPIPRKLAEILNNAPALEEYKLFSVQKIPFNGDSAMQQIWFMPTEMFPTSIEHIAGQLKTFGFFMIEGEGGSHPLSFGKTTLDAVQQTRFQDLQTLAVLQFNNYLSTPEFLEILGANASTLTSLEYTFIFGIGLESHKLIVPITEPPRLISVTHLGLYFMFAFERETFASSFIERWPILIPQMREIGLMILQLQHTCLMCPNLKILSTDINLCEALACFELYIRTTSEGLDPNLDLPDSFLEYDKMRKEKNLHVTTLEVAFPHAILPFELEDVFEFGVCMARFWPDKFPALHKIIIKMDIWPREEAVLRLPVILNIPGITVLEIVEYSQDWIGQELANPTNGDGDGSLANLQQGLRRLRLSATQITSRSYSKLSKPQRKRMNGKSLKWPEGVLSLCGTFQVLEEVVIDRRVFLNTIPVLGRTTTDKGVKITVL